MLRKLLKYDLRANLKVYLIIWPAILVLGLMERLLIRADLSGSDVATLGITITMLFILAIFGALIFSLIVAVTRFYKGLLGEEGYLMFTLPVRPWQLITSKLLTAMLTIIVTIAVSGLACFFMLSGIDGLLEIISDTYEMLGVPQSTSIVLALLVSLTMVARELLQIYMSCAIGHLANKRRVLWSVCAFYGINIIMSFISATGVLTFDETMPYNSYLLIELAAQLALSALYFFITNRILSKKLNLE